MVQGKSPEQKRSHGGVRRQVSSDLHQDTSGRAGADLEKKLKKQVRSMKISGFDNLEHSPTMDFQFKKTAFSPIRNYMKPTKCSDARKGNLRATVTSPASSSSPAAPVKKCSAVTSTAKKNLNRATCSSTLKDSKFPAALVLNSEGTSKMRVCPYTYCSLNGHMPEFSSPPPPPPLKCFISERRRILKNQRSMDMETLFSVKTRNNEEEKIGEERVNEIIEFPSDLFAEIHTIPPEDIIGEKNCGEINIQDEKDQVQYCLFDENQCRYVLDQTSERSQDELDDVMANLLEYVEVDDEEKAQQDYEFEDNRDAKNSGIKSMDMYCEAEDDSDEAESKTEHRSLETANFFQYVEADDEEEAQQDYEFEENGDAKSSHFESMDMYCEAEDDSEEGEFVAEHSSPETADLQPSENEGSTAENTMLNASSIDLNEIDGNLSTKWNITRKIRTEELEQAKEFNPKPPNFLPLEPDPEAEKVDLKHQTMDMRRSAEEWMIDYALQHAVTKLGDPARKKKKVALLVEAFETVVPLHTCQTPVSHGTSSFTNLSFIQACS